MNIPQPMIIGCTGHSDQKSINECIWAGMDEVLMKPVSPEQLNNIIRKIKFKTTDLIEDENEEV